MPIYNITLKSEDFPTVRLTSVHKNVSLAEAYVDYLLKFKGAPFNKAFLYRTGVKDVACFTKHAASGRVYKSVSGTSVSHISTKEKNFWNLVWRPSLIAREMVS